jgi:hypothetical protein
MPNSSAGLRTRLSSMLRTTTSHEGPASRLTASTTSSHRAHPALNTSTLRLLVILALVWSRSFTRAHRTGDQHDAYSIAAWLSRADRDGSLAAFLKPKLTPAECAVAIRSGVNDHLGGADQVVMRGDMKFRPPYQAPQRPQFGEIWSAWQDLNLRPPRPERGTRPPYSVRQ